MKLARPLWLLAGLTGAIVVLPQGVAFATLAGMPPAYGLYAAMMPCVIAADGDRDSMPVVVKEALAMPDHTNPALRTFTGEAR